MPIAATSLEQILPQNLQMESCPVDTTKLAWGSEQRRQPFWTSDLQECKALNGALLSCSGSGPFLCRNRELKHRATGQIHLWRLATQASIALYTILNHELGLYHLVIFL